MKLVAFGPAVLLIAASVAAGEGFESPEPPAEKPEQATWGFNVAYGTGGMAGNFGKLLRFPMAGEFGFFRARGNWRYGLGVNFSSYKMEQPWDQELEWGYQRTYLQATRVFRRGATLEPYLQLRAGLARLHPRSELFPVEPPPENPGDSPTKPSNGFSAGVIPGVEIRLNKSLALDVSGYVDWFKVSEYDLSPPTDYPDASAGTTWEFRLGLRWHPDDGWPSGGGRPGQPDRERDAWGVSRNYGWAAGEVLAINLGASAFNEYVRNANFNQISPRSWWHNIEEGFTYDDNKFRTNQFNHPFNGAAYFNSGRANGLGFWPSTGYALGGAFFWECCGETHPMSFNDMISTGIGGMAFGELQFRISSEILNNQSTGRGRRWRELAAFLVDPIRGLNRQVSGRARRADDNPTDPMDWRPPGGTTFVALGARVIGEGSSITENTQTYGTLLLNHSYGNVWENERRKPFDYFDLVAEMYTGEKTRLGNLQIRGNLASWPLGSATSPNHVLALVQNFDYMDNTAYEFGGQALGLSLQSRFKLSDKVGLTTRADATGMILGAVNADYSFVADVADRERYREYDYGPGIGGMATASLSVSGRPLLSALYRVQRINVTNGSVYNKGQVGLDAHHTVQAAGLRLVLPIRGGLGIGADGYLFLRDSTYTLAGSGTGATRDKDIRQRNPQARVYLSWFGVR
jgi:hypothetical protein